MFRNAIDDKGWQETGIFPRVTYCDFNQPVLGKKYQGRTVQCVLMVNMLNEKIFVFIWFWLAFALILSVLNIFYVAVVLFIPYVRQLSTHYYVRNTSLSNASVTSYKSNDLFFLLLFTSQLSDLDDDKKIEFANRVLGPDGIHLLHLIQTHSGGQVASQIAAALFDAMSESYC